MSSSKSTSRRRVLQVTTCAAGSRPIASVERVATGPDAGLLVTTWDIVLESGRS